MEKKVVVICGGVGFLGLLSAVLGFAAEATKIKGYCQPHFQQLPVHFNDSISIRRTVTNVGNPDSIYRAVVHPPTGINVTVIPKLLVFRSYGQKMNFTVNLRVEAPLKDYVFGSLSWKSADARVTSPLVVRIVSFSKENAGEAILE